MLNVGLLIIRIVVGLTFIGHGSQKLFGWFGGYGLKGTGGWMDSIGMKPGVLMAAIAGIAEFFGGILFATGVWLPLGSALIVITMLGAMVSVHAKNGYWVDKGGIEYPFVLIALVVGVALIGSGNLVL